MRYLQRCDGDLHFPSTSKTPAPTTISTTMTTTTPRSTSQSVTTTTAKTPGITTLLMTTSASVNTSLHFTTDPRSSTSNIATTNHFLYGSTKTTKIRITPTSEIRSQDHSTTTECKNLQYSYFPIKKNTHS